MFRSGLLASVIVAGVGVTTPVFAQSTVYIPAILELSGAGAVSGTNFRDGMLLAIDEINAKGGILGRKIETPLLDTQSDASISRAQVQKVLDNKPLRHSRPGLLGLGAGRHVADAAGRNSRDRRRRGGGHHPEGKSLRLPYVVRSAIQHAEDRQLHARRRQGKDGRRAVGEQRLRQRRSRYLRQGNGRA